ncbi:hypothetical protein C0Q88_07525 [Ralstonia pickettii]|uniref:Uncharacterized protein n=1 Tax=Ralstonia pickettii TaxID=329 RepID=A0A2N4TXU4_RALPI|nr:DUF6573 family protein [Ralstonia pickettii]PLC44520.1 hypothetical protein C0Q88_07525 [Ralstonia pickettii]
MDESTPVYRYTRAMAIADGVLVDVTPDAKNLGFVFPVAISQAAYGAVVAWTEEDSKRKPNLGQSDAGRLHDVLFMLHAAIVTAQVTDTLMFYVLAVPRDQSRQTDPVRHKLKAVVGPGDNGEGVITIMLPDED